MHGIRDQLQANISYRIGAEYTPGHMDSLSFLNIAQGRLHNRHLTGAVQVRQIINAALGKAQTDS
jgi:hypothetical protein